MEWLSHLAGQFFVFNYCGVDWPEAQALEPGRLPSNLETSFLDLRNRDKKQCHICYYN